MQRCSPGLLLFGVLILGCSSPSSGDTDTSTGAGTGTDTGTTAPTTAPDPTSAPDPTTASDPTTAPDPTTGATTQGSSSTGPVDETTGTMTTSGSSGGTTEDMTSGGGTCVPLQCDGALYACGDCMDNDGDGKVDGSDPECVSPCDDKEDTFSTGLPGDNMDPCKQDCFFDGNSGGGPGDCAWNLACDPLGPGGDKCPYDPNQQNCPDQQTPECVMNCQVPNGCDCFGCCTVVVDGMAYDIFLGDQDCSLADLDKCEMCTPNVDCDDECHPEQCEVCFGQELPPECDNPTCDTGTPCTVDDMGASNCPPDQFCNTGCCALIVPG